MVTLRCRGNQDLRSVEWVARLVGRGAQVYFVRPGLEGRALVSSFGPGPAWLGWLAAAGLEPGSVVADDELRERARAASAVAVAMAAALVALGASACVAPELAAAFALAAGLSFAGAPTLAQGLWQQTAALPFLASAVAAALWADRYPKLLAVATFCAGCAAWLRPADLPLLAGVAVCALSRSLRRERSLRTVAAALVTACAGAAPTAIWNLWYFDTPFSIAQWSANQRITEHVFSTSPRDVALGLAGLAASPGRGIALFAPLVPLVSVLAVVGLRRAREARDPALETAARDAALLVAGIVGEWLVAGTFFKWWGGAGFGPRLLAGAVWVAPAATALLFPGLGPALRRLVFAAGAFGAALGLAGIFRFDLTAVEMELDGVHRPEPFFSFRAGPWTSLASPPTRAVRDGPLGPFVYCGAHSLGTAP